MVCHNCGRVASDMDGFCSSCGVVLKNKKSGWFGGFFEMLASGKFGVVKTLVYSGFPLWLVIYQVPAGSIESLGVGYGYSVFLVIIFLFPLLFLNFLGVSGIWRVRPNSPVASFASRILCFLLVIFLIFMCVLIFFLAFAGGFISFFG